MWKIERYTKEKKKEWDSLVQNSKNGTFLFHRDYIDYNLDRFPDCSLMCYFKGNLYAVLPATKDKNGVFSSHSGLTYGGFVVDIRMTTLLMFSLFDGVLNYIRDVIGAKEFLYSSIPYIYTSIPSEEDAYALFRYDFKLIGRKVSSVINLSNPLTWSELRKRKLKLSDKNEIHCCTSNEYERFWNVLETNLKTRHNTLPVHTKEEIEKLHGLFPNNIILFVALDKCNVLQAGIVIYFSKHVAHVQYIGSTQEGRAVGAVDSLVFYIIQYYNSAGIDYIDFGTSVKEGGKELCEGLIFQKEGFGGRAVCYDTYSLEL